MSKDAEISWNNWINTTFRIIFGLTIRIKNIRNLSFYNFSYDIEITSEVVGRAPIPELIIGVKQAGVLIDDELTVKPGTPLNMEINLDNESKDIYGLMVSKMEVTDNRRQNEILIING